MNCHANTHVDVILDLVNKTNISGIVLRVRVNHFQKINMWIKFI